MNLGDSIVIGSCLLCAFIGFRYLSTRSFFALVGAGSGIVLAIYYHRPLADFVLQGWTGWRGYVTFAIIVAGTFLTAKAIGALVTQLLQVSRLSWLDRVLGVVVGATSGGLIACTVMATISRSFPSIAHSVMGQYGLASLLTGQLSAMLALLPEELDFIRNLLA